MYLIAEIVIVVSQEDQEDHRGDQIDIQAVLDLIMLIFWINFREKADHRNKSEI